MTHRLLIWIRCCLFVWFVAGGAMAAGLVATPGPSQPHQLSRLSNIELAVEVADSLATVLEIRTYAVDSQTFDVEPTSVVFHRSLPAGSSVELAEIDIDGVSSDLTGEVLDAARADELRHRLAVDLGDPAPLRELGQRLFVSDPIEAYLGARVTISMQSAAPLHARGTLQSVDTPLDWHPDDVPLVTITLEANTELPLRAVYSPYHELDVSREDDHRAVASYEGRNVCSRFDVSLMLSSGTESVHLDLLPFRSADPYLEADAAFAEGESGYVLGLLTPTLQPTSQPGRDLAVAIDVSGSMAGEKLDQAKLALADVIDGLVEGDSLSLITFSGVVEVVGDEAQPATEENKARLLNSIPDLVAEGGTNISGALEQALSSLGRVEAVQGRARSVVLLTDGVPTEGVTDIDAIADLARDLNVTGSRIFTFGLGSDVNTLLLDRLAKDSGGLALYVRENTLADKVREFFASISAPVLTHPELLSLDGSLTELFPKTLPDLYAGRTQTFVARYAPSHDAVLRLQGEASSGAIQTDYELQLPSYAAQDGSVARLWALRQVGELLERLKVVGRDEALEQQALQLARRFGVVTEFTYFETTEDGDLEFVFSTVPTDAVGESAVATSASISGYSTSATTEDTVDTTVRYYQDRNFPLQGGYRTDASLAPTASDTSDAAWIDLHYGSAKYFAAVAVEAEFQLGGFLSIGRDVRFAHLGRLFRVTDPSREDLSQLPAESKSVPTPDSWPDTKGETRVVLVTEDVASGDPSDDRCDDCGPTPSGSSGDRPDDDTASDGDTGSDDNTSNGDTGDGSERSSQGTADAGSLTSADAGKNPDRDESKAQRLKQASPSRDDGGCNVGDNGSSNPFGLALLATALLAAAARLRRRSAAEVGS